MNEPVTELAKPSTPVSRRGVTMSKAAAVAM